MMKREPELLSGLSARPSSSSSFQYPQGVVWADDEASSSAVVLPVVVGTSQQPSKKKKAPSKTSVFVCTELHCGKTFPRSFALRRHLRIHTGTKPYACDFEGCTQRFNTSGNLSRHKRIHSGERPYPCIFATCGKRFNTSTKLKRHMRIHFPEGQNLFRCVGGNCTFTSDNYKEFAQHQKLNHNVIVGAQLENASRRAEATAAATANTMSVKDNDYFSVADTTTSNRMDYDHQQIQPPSYNPASSFLYGASSSYAAPEKPKVQQQQPRKIMGSYFPSDIGGLASLPVLKDTGGKKPLDVELSVSSGYDLASASSRSRAKPPSAAFPSSSYQSRTPSNSSSALGYDSFTLSDSNSTSSYVSRSTLLPSTSYSNHYSSQWRTDDDQVGPDSDEYGQPHQQQQQQQQQGSFNSLHHLTPHHVLRPPPTTNEDVKYGSFQVPPPMNPASAEFTGEELSAVLQLMNDPYP